MTSTATLEVTAVNDGPVAVEDRFAGGEDRALSGAVLDNDRDVDGDSLSVVAGTYETAEGGTVVLAADGRFTYTPAADFHGEDSFSYTVTDGAATATGTVSLTVSPENDGPVVGTVDLGATAEDTTFTFSADDLLAQASDVDGDALTVTSVSVDPAYGTLVDNGAGSYSFTPAENWHGSDVPFSFTVSDGTESVTSTATLDVTAVADSPLLQATMSVVNTTDAGFEDAVITDGTQTSTSGFYMNDTLGDWSTDSGAFEIWSENQQSQAYSASEGDQFIELNKDTTGTYTDTMNIYQDVETVEGHEYTFSFDFSPRPGYDEDVSKVEVWIDGEKVEEISGSGVGASNTNWSSHEYSFTGDGSPVRVEIKYTGEGAAYGRGAYIDNLNITDTHQVDWAASGEAGKAIVLPEISAALTDTDGSETLTLEISGIPEGAVLSDGNGNTFTATDAENTVDVSDWDFAHLSITPPEGASDFDLEVTATSTEQSTGESATQSQTLSVDITNAASNEPDDDDDDDDLSGDNDTNTVVYDNEYIGDNNWDNVKTGNGNDYIDVKDGGSKIKAGNGHNKVLAGDGWDDVKTGKGDDIIDVGDGGSKIKAGNGDNRITATGSEGNDVTTGKGDDIISLGSGWDKVNSGNGDDIINVGDGGSEIKTGDGNNQITAGDGWDEVKTGDGDNIIHVGDGGSEIKTGDGNNQITATGSGDNRVDTGDGNDTITLGSGWDEVNSGGGDDVISVGAGGSEIKGGGGNDTFIFEAHDAYNSVEGGFGAGWTDTIQLNGFAGQNAEQGWTLVLEEGSSISSTDNVNGEMLLSEDSSGTIVFEDGGEITFDGIEKIVW